MTAILKNTARALTSLSGVGHLASLGYPVFATAAGFLVIVLAIACWIISDNDRTDRLARIILARRGKPTLPTTHLTPRDGAAKPERLQHP
jgi:hypothetical protein